MKKQIVLPESSVVLSTKGLEQGQSYPLNEDVFFSLLVMVNLVFIGSGKTNRWLLVDTGISGMEDHIIHAAEDRFGRGTRPAAILLTHGHFDHVGSIQALLRHWNVPVYAHSLEFPYLTGAARYPQPDTSAPGLFSKLSRFYPRDPIDLSPHLRELPDDGSIPGFLEWRWIHTPGHTPGHISLWRERDRTLVAGDAFITTGQESAYAVLMQRPELHGPPMYFTADWNAAADSVARLAKLKPEQAITGHGPPVAGPEFTGALTALADNFFEVAVPDSRSENSSTEQRDSLM
jgi:glyoxylase-like metal-dependent hydrolase (beta-lactamase superfamily II)